MGMRDVQRVPVISLQDSGFNSSTQRRLNPGRLVTVGGVAVGLPNLNYTCSL